MITSSEKEIEILKEGGKILAGAINELIEKVKPGISTKELDSIAENFIISNGGKPSFKGYKPVGADISFPSTLCTSINEEVVHGLPGDKRLAEGDIIGLDLGVNYKGFFTDMAVTIGVGDIDADIKKLMENTKIALEKGIESIKPGLNIGDIGHAIESHVKPFGYGIIKELVGHGVGKAVHEEPQIPNYGKPGDGPKIVEGMVLALEPMFTLGSEKVILLPDKWTWITEDRSIAAHFEHTVLVTKKGAHILTKI